MRKHSRLYVYWVEFDSCGEHKKRPVELSRLSFHVSPYPKTLGILFEPDDMNVPIVRKNFSLKKVKTFDQYVNVLLEHYRKVIQKDFDKKVAETPVDFRGELNYTIRFGRANSKECPFYVPQRTIRNLFNAKSPYRGSCLKNVTIVR